jgi:hypothetical protein
MAGYLMSCAEEHEKNPDKASDWLADRIHQRTGKHVAPGTVRDVLQAEKKGEIECAVKENGAAETSYSGSALVIYAAHMFGAPWLLKFLSYLLCLLFGFPSTNNASLCSDPFLKLYHRNCLEVHKDLEQLGRCLVI